MKQQNIFQIVVLGIFSVMFFIGFLGFSGKIPFPGSKDDVNYGEVTFWGTIPAQVMTKIVGDATRNQKAIKINYVYKSKETISQDLVQALARGEGPDLFMLPQDQLLGTLDKISLIPYKTYSERAFKDTFIEDGELYLKSQGIVGIPFVVDPMVMYWNRDILTSAGIVSPPQRWAQFYEMAPKVVVRDQQNNLTRSFVPFGEYQNVTHAKDLISMLILQSGNSIVIQEGGILHVDIALDSSALSPSARSISFFTEFSRKEKDVYSWNRSLPDSRSAFEAGDLALYFGYASEYSAIHERNPHLNFDIASMPQADQVSKRLTYGNIQAISIAKASKNQAGAMYAALVLTQPQVIKDVSVSINLPPVRRDLLVTPPSDAINSVFYDSALIAHAWTDPSPDQTDKLFRDMVNDITSGERKVSESLSILQSAMSKIMVPYQRDI